MITISERHSIGTHLE